MAMSAKAWKFMMPAKLDSCETLLKGLAQDLEDMASELRQFIEEEHAVVCQRHLARHQDVAPADQPHLRAGLVRPATGWRRVVSIASASVIAGMMVVGRRPSIVVPTLGGLRLGHDRFRFVRLRAAERVAASGQQSLLKEGPPDAF
jgi:hypothetical protein